MVYTNFLLEMYKMPSFCLTSENQFPGHCQVLGHQMASLGHELVDTLCIAEMVKKIPADADISGGNH